MNLFRVEGNSSGDEFQEALVFAFWCTSAATVSTDAHGSAGGRLSQVPLAPRERRGIWEMRTLVAVHLSITFVVLHQVSLVLAMRLREDISTMWKKFRRCGTCLWGAQRNTDNQDSLRLMGWNVSSVGRVNCAPPVFTAWQGAWGPWLG